MFAEVPRITHRELSQPGDSSENTTIVKKRVKCCRQIQLDRCGKLNSALTTVELDSFCKPTNAGRQVLKHAMKKMNLSPRGFHRVLKLARTLADLEQLDTIQEQQVLEALSYRRS